MHLRRTLTHCRALAEALANAVEGRFPHVFSFSTESKVYAAAAACHPKFKLRWVADVRKDWVKEAFLSEARNITPAVSEDDHRVPAPQTATTGDDFFDFHDLPQENEQQTAANRVTMECLQYLEQPCSDYLDTLHQFPAVKQLFRKLNAAVPSSVPVERLFSSGSVICTPHRNRLSDKEI